MDAYFNDKKTGEAIDNKCLYEYLFSGVRLPETLAKRMNGYWFASNSQPIDIEKVVEIADQNESVFFKVAIGSCGGKGVHCLSGNEIKEKIPELSKKIQNDIVIQKPIHQHEEISKINPSSVNTLRILSLLTKNGAKIFSSVLRMGINGAKVDNASSGGITCGIKDDGTLKAIAFTKKGESFHEHPTTKVCFDGITVPCYKEIIEETKKLSLRFPMFRMVSWDWAIGKDEKPILIEANLFNGELDFHQLNNGPVFGKDTKEILDEIFKSKK